MLIEQRNCALKLVNEISLYYDARSKKKHQIKPGKFIYLLWKPCEKTYVAAVKRNMNIYIHWLRTLTETAHEMYRNNEIAYLLWQSYDYTYPLISILSFTIVVPDSDNLCIVIKRSPGNKTALDVRTAFSAVQPVTAA